MERYFGAALITVLIYIIYTFQPQLSTVKPVFAETKTQTDYTLPNTQPVTTESLFKENFKTETEILPKKTIYEDDPETEAGIDKILDEGEDGKRVTTTKVTYYNPNTSDGGPERSRRDSSEVDKGEEYSREVVSVDITPAKDKKLLRGTKIIWKTLATPDGEIKYWKKMKVYATHYDQHCNGCNEWTATGMRAGKGVIAVDPKIIKLRSKVYIPGYGHAIAGDTGGAIKGNIIDLGFDDAKTAGWSARYVDIYLL